MEKKCRKSFSSAESCWKGGFILQWSQVWLPFFFLCLPDSRASLGAAQKAQENTNTKRKKEKKKKATALFQQFWRERLRGQTQSQGTSVGCREVKHTERKSGNIWANTATVPAPPAYFHSLPASWEHLSTSPCTRRITTKRNLHSVN